MQFTHVHTPITIGKVVIKNRILRSAHSTAIGAGTLSDDLVAYHEARAKGGVGLSVLEAMSVHPTSLSTLNMIDPSLGEKYPRMVDRLRPTGMRLFQQLFHAGQHGRNLDGNPPWGPSDQPGVDNGVVPIVMTKMMIDTIVEAYARAAKQLEAWGSDGVEFHAGHGFLPQQFLSVYTNDRQDDYGGSLENRARFIIEALTAIRAEVSRDFVVGIRLSPDMMAGGVGIDDNIYVAKAIEAAGLVDYVSVSSGNFQTIGKTIGGMHEPTGFEMDSITPVTNAVSLPTMVVGRIRTLEEADQFIRAGNGDMVAMVRAMIADPDLVRKSFEGKAEQVRPCIACNQGCIGQLLAAPNRMGCAVNPAVGFELKMGDDRLVPADQPQKILVVGGGPAGMEAARVAALRGHQVILVEAEPDLGGTVKLAALAPTRGTMKDIIIWQQDEIYRLGVDVRTGTYMDAEDIVAEGADKVILATGSMPRLDGIQLSNPGEPVEGIDHPKVISSNELFLERDNGQRKSAVVIDDVGHYEAIACADLLVSRGVAVTFVTRHHSFGPLIESSLMTEPALRRLSGGQFSLHTRTRAVSISDTGVRIAPTYLSKGSDRGIDVAADTVVFVSRNRPNRDMYEALKAQGVPVVMVGDGNAPRFIPVAMREGNSAGAAC